MRPTWLTFIVAPSGARRPFTMVVMQQVHSPAGDCARFAH
jgi:hypothetical protein